MAKLIQVEFFTVPANTENGFPMASSAKFIPAPRSLAQDFVEAFFTIFVGGILQIGRAIQLLVLKIQRAKVRNAFHNQAVQMGKRMVEAGIADQHDQDRLKTIPESQTVLREQLLAEIGELGLELGVPPLGLEEGYNAGHQAYQRLQQVEYAHDETAYRLVPHSPLGWFALFVSYLLTGWLLLWLVASLTTMPLPESLRWLVGKGTPTTLSVAFDTVRVEFLSAEISSENYKLYKGQRVFNLPHDLYLLIKIRIYNIQLNDVEYRTWRSNVIINDDRGHRLNHFLILETAIPEGGIETATIPFQGSIDDVIIIAPPQPKFKRLDLFLPGENVGVPGETKQLTIPVNRIKLPETYQ